MKKLLFLLAGSLLTMSLSAQKITVASGSVAPLKDQKVIHFTYTYDDMRVGKMSETEYVEKKTGEYNEKEPGRGDYWAVAWQEDRPMRFQPKFEELFDKYMEDYGVLAGPEDQAVYCVEINTDFTEPGFNVGVMRRNASIDLTCRVVKIDTGEQVAVVKIVGSSANNFMGTDFDTGFRIQECYAKAGREFAQFLVKTNKMK